MFQADGSESVTPSVVASALEETSDSKDPVQLHDIKGVAATMYAAGVDTVTSIRLLPAALTKNASDLGGTGSIFRCHGIKSRGSTQGSRRD